MRNKIGLSIFVVGFLGLCGGIMMLDSMDITIPLVVIVIGFLVSTVGYLMTDVEEVIEGTGYQKIKDSKIVQMRKARNREIVWQTWIATKNAR